MDLGQCISNTVLLDLWQLCEIDERQYNMGPSTTSNDQYNLGRPWEYAVSKVCQANIISHNRIRYSSLAVRLDISNVIGTDGSIYASVMTHVAVVVALKRMYPPFYICFFHSGSIVVFSSITAVSGTFETRNSCHVSDVQDNASDKNHR